MNKEIRAAVIVFLVFLVIAGIFGYQAYQLSEQKAQLELDKANLETEITGLEAKVGRLQGLKDELREIEENLSQYIKILPSPEVATQERLLELVQEKRERAQLAPESIDIKSDKRAKGDRSAKSGFLEIDVTIGATATFEQFLRFLNALERHETFLRVNSFTCNLAGSQVEDDETYPLTITLNLSTFRYEAGK